MMGCSYYRRPKEPADSDIASLCTALAAVAFLQTYKASLIHFATLGLLTKLIILVLVLSYLLQQTDVLDSDATAKGIISPYIQIHAPEAFLPLILGALAKPAFGNRLTSRRR